VVNKGVYIVSARKKVVEELTKDIIIAEANRQFLTKDYHQVSMRAIAKELDCSHGAIYYHFANKAELFYAVISQYFDEVNALLKSALLAEGDSKSRTMSVFTGFIEFGLNHQSQYQFMFMMRNNEVDPLAQKAANESYDQFAQTLQHIHQQNLSIAKIYSVFISLHGFVSFFLGAVENYNEAKETAIMHAKFLLDALD